MCHDGALPRTIPQSDSTSQHEPNGAREDNEYVEEQTDFEIDSNAATDMKVRLRHSMFLFMRGGHNVALINGLTFRDTKVCSLSFKILTTFRSGREQKFPDAPESLGNE